MQCLKLRATEYNFFDKFYKPQKLVLILSIISSWILHNQNLKVKIETGIILKDLSTLFAHDLDINKIMYFDQLNLQLQSIKARSLSSSLAKFEHSARINFSPLDSSRALKKGQISAIPIML